MKDKEPNIKQKDIAMIMNLINDALENTEYEAVGYEANVNTEIYLNVLIDKK